MLPFSSLFLPLPFFHTKKYKEGTIGGRRKMKGPPPPGLTVTADALVRADTLLKEMDAYI